MYVCGYSIKTSPPGRSWENDLEIAFQFLRFEYQNPKLFFTNINLYNSMQAYNYVDPFEVKDPSEVEVRTNVDFDDSDLPF
jgi:hypothetical protein